MKKKRAQHAEKRDPPEATRGTATNACMVTSETWRSAQCRGSLPNQSARARIHSTLPALSILDTAGHIPGTAGHRRLAQ